MDIITNVEVQRKKGGRIEVLFEFDTLKKFFRTIPSSDIETKTIRIGTKFIYGNTEYKVIDVCYDIYEQTSINGNHKYNSFLTMWVE